MDTSDPLIEFDENGVCDHCNRYFQYLRNAGTFSDRSDKLSKLKQTLKSNQINNEYDCIMGLSGGVDSSYLVWYCVTKLDLKPLVVHVDAGWNSELAVNNIQNIVQRLGLDLHTVVIDWAEMRDLQRSFFLSGVANLDVPQDHAFIAALHREAARYGIQDILSGGNMQTESILPIAWGYDASDAKSIKSIHKRFGTKPLKTYPFFTSWHRLLYYPFLRKIRTHRPLDLMDYNKDEAKKVLIEKLGWRDYGGKHYESAFTKFFQAHYLPTKFNFDKRLAHLSSLVVSGQLDRQDALSQMNEPLYNEEDLVKERTFWIKKLGVTQDEYNQVMSATPKLYSDYPNNEEFFRFASKIWAIVKKVRNFATYRNE